jgi:ketosteroid isomerase-like protein
MRLLTGITLAVSLLASPLLGACSGSAATQAAEARRLLQTDRTFAAASLEQGTAAAFFANMTEDAVQLPANAAPVQGRKRIRDRLDNLGAQVLDWTPQQAEVSRALDLGWTWGEWRLYRSAASKEVIARGKYLNVWKRGADGAWKLAADIGNQAEDPALQTAPSP